MIVSGWYSGLPDRSKGVYGLKVKPKDRDVFFNRGWSSVFVVWGGFEFEVGITASFWRNCSELRSPVFREQFLKEGLAPWPKGEPPKFRLDKISSRRFSLSLI